MCPHCGSQMFMAKITRAGLVEFTTDSNESCKILKENKDKFDIEIVGCARCKANVVETDLIVGVRCKECGKVVNPMDINSDGVCNVCDAVKQREELANASKEDLIKMLLDAEKKINPVAIKMEKQIEKADEAIMPEKDATDIEQPVDIQDTSDANEKVELRPKRKATRKKKADDNNTEDNKEPEDEAVEEKNEDPQVAEINNLANQQEAPFPDMNLPEEDVNIKQEDEQPIGADFRMFDDGEEPF